MRGDTCVLTTIIMTEILVSPERCDTHSSLSFREALDEVGIGLEDVNSHRQVVRRVTDGMEEEATFSLHTRLQRITQTCMYT